MRLSEVVQIVARRLGVRPGRVSGIASRLQHAGLLPITEGSRRYPPDVDLPHVVDFILAVAADRGLGNAADTARQVGAFRADDGITVADLVLAALQQRACVEHVILRADGASAVVDGAHHLFGEPPPEDGALNATAIPGTTLAAIAAELAGLSLEQADAVAAITKIRNF